RQAHRRLLRDDPPLSRRRPVAGQKLAVPGRYRMPAEWERHAATWIGWPHNRTDWPGKFAAIPWVYGEIVRRLAPAGTVPAFVESGAPEAAARRVLTRVGVDSSRLEFLRMPTDRGWTRDSGPAFVEDGRNVAIVRFRFNGWARYSDYKKDDRMPEFAARRGPCRIFRAHA